MSDRSHIRELLLHSRQAAARQMELIHTQRPLTYAYLHEHLFQYVLDKYMLQRKDCPPDESFNDLAERSLAGSMKISRDLVEEFDTARSCDGATSVMAKKVLLFLAIQRDLDIELPARESAQIKTMEDMTRMVWHTMAESTQWRQVMAPDNETSNT
jgi:hypothetical protein